MNLKVGDKVAIIINGVPEYIDRVSRLTTKDSTKCRLRHMSGRFSIRNGQSDKNGDYTITDDPKLIAEAEENDYCAESNGRGASICDLCGEESWERPDGRYIKLTLICYLSGKKNSAAERDRLVCKACLSKLPANQDGWPGAILDQLVRVAESVQ